MICPKCGSEAGWNGPSYSAYETGMIRDGTWGIRECLVFTCVRCGFSRSERTQDAPPKPPDPPTDTDTGTQFFNWPWWPRKQKC